MGALEFAPAIGPRAKQTIHIEVGKLVELASEVLAHRNDLQTSFAAEGREDALRDILRVGTSAGGARAKAVIAWNPETNWLPCNTGLPSPTSNLLEMGFDTSGFLYSVVSASNGHNAGLFRSVAEVNPPKSSVYQFTGNGAWSDPNNWANANKPGLNVGGNKIVIINPGPNGECILDQPLNLSNGAKLKIYPGKKFTILD